MVDFKYNITNSLVLAKKILNREPLKYLPLSPDILEDKNILITGAGGSIGHIIALKISKYPINKLFLLGRGENSIFKTYHKLITNIGSTSKIVPVVLDLTNLSALLDFLSHHHIDLIINTASHKHLWLLELYPKEGIRNNVLIAINLSKAIVNFNIQNVIHISTDKVVSPNSILGLTKKLQELIFASIPINIRIARLANVIGSRGSVLEIFLHNLKRNKPLIVRGLDTTRYFITPNEAANLVLSIISFPSGIYIPNVKNPTKIYDIAKRLKRLLNYDAKILISNLLPSEKPHEHLLDAYEEKVPTPISSILKVKSPIYEHLYLPEISIEVENMYTRLMQLQDASIIKQSLTEFVNDLIQARV